MQVTNKKMYHLHKIGKYDELWVPKNEIIIDDNFSANFDAGVREFATAVDLTDGTKEAFNTVIENYLKEPQTEETLIRMLETSTQIIYNANLFKREIALEEIRQKYYHHLPSRKHAIWVTDKKSLEFWKKTLSNFSNSEHKLALFQVYLTGTLFKSSDYLLPNNELTYEQSLEAAHCYWNPDYRQIPKDRNEYLFQGKLKIAKQLKL